MELWIVRHGKAAVRGPDWPDDGLRPLTEAGKRQAERLARLVARLEVRFDRLVSSPLVRAAQTAEPLRRALVPGRTVEYVDALAEAGAEDLLGSLPGLLEPGDERVVCVGHEPQVSAVASVLLTGRPDGLALGFRKGAVLVLEGELAPAAMALHAFVPAAVVEALIEA